MDFKKERKTKLLNAIYNYSPSHFMEKDEKVYFKPESFSNFKFFFPYLCCFLIIY